jgi:ankyrin repeat protein
MFATAPDYQQLQDSYGRTALHVAATCGSVEVVSMMCKFDACNLNPVDGFGYTRLDNARMKNQRAAAALLEEYGALPGSDPSLASAAEEVASWIHALDEERRTNRMREVLQSLPEEKAVRNSAAVVCLQKTFVQVGSLYCGPLECLSL